MNSAPNPRPMMATFSSFALIQSSVAALDGTTCSETPTLHVAKFYLEHDDYPRKTASLVFGVFQVLTEGCADNATSLSRDRQGAVGTSNFAEPRLSGSGRHLRSVTVAARLGRVDCL